MKTPIRTFIVVGTLLTQIPVAGAQDVSFRPQDDALLTSCLATDAADSDHGRRACIGVAKQACVQEPDGDTTLGTTFCNFREESWWDSNLNQNYAELKASLEPEVFDTLRTAQQAWIVYRDAKCDFDYKLFEQGTIRHILFSDCRMKTTAERANDLAHILLDWMG